MNITKLGDAVLYANSNKQGSKIASNHINAYYNSVNTELYHVYNNYSYRKLYAFEYCKSLMYDLGGFDLRIISYNCMQFSVGFQFYDETGNLMFAYITRDYNRFCYQ